LYTGTDLGFDGLKLYDLPSLRFPDKTPGKQSKGRQPMRWMDSIHKWTQLGIKQLNTLIKERESWRKLSHRDAQSAKSGESG